MLYRRVAGSQLQNLLQALAKPMSSIPVKQVQSLWAEIPTNDSAGCARLIGWIVEHTSGPRLVVPIEGSRSYDVWLARAVSTRVDENRNAFRAWPRCQPVVAHNSSQDDLFADRSGPL